MPLAYLETNRRHVSLGARPLVMGVLNITPDSFYDGGRHATPEAALRQARRLVDEGADILDIGGESSRPGARPVPAEEEIARVVPVIRQLAPELGIPISIDTFKPAVAREALAAGAEIINDITGLRDEDMVRVAAESGAAVVAMHMRGMPWNMQELPPSPDIMAEVKHFFVKTLQQSLKKTKIVLDPGIGFGKTITDNLILLNRLAEFRAFDCPILVGVSRKSFIGHIVNAPSEERLPGSLTAAVLAAREGAAIIRCHDVAETVQSLRVMNAILNEELT